MPKKKKGRFGTFLLILAVIFSLWFIGVAIQVMTQLPNIDAIGSYAPSESTILYSSDEKILARFHQEENRQVVALENISPYLLKAVIAVEDPNFYSHHGLDFSGILRAAVKNFAYGRVVEGGSTITQQLAKNLFLTRKKNLSRKMAEALIALQIERHYTKDEILELYVNQVYLGHNSYGIESAANLYFGKHATDLTLAESAMIAGLIRGPELYSPYRNFKGAKLRQVQVLNKMLEQDFIAERDAKLAAIESLSFSPKNLKRYGEIAPYFISYILQKLTEEYGDELVYHGGLKVYTTLDTRMQTAAENVISSFVGREGKKYNFSQATLVSIDPRNGCIRAMVGGASYFESKYNRAVQAKRQPGSSFKPFIYTAAIEEGFLPNDTISDAPISFKVWPNKWNPKGYWAPKNFDGRFHGEVTLRHALEQSLNIPAIKLLEQVGTGKAIEVAQRMGIESRLDPGLSLALGASEVSNLELTSAFGVLANNGVRFDPVSITKIENRDGEILFEQEPEGKRVLDPNVAAIMTDMMRGVVTRGTGYQGNIGRPAAAKTGTTQNFRDAWFVGFVPQLVTGVWVGNDNNSPMRGIAEVSICPRIWKAYNISALAGQPIYDFPKPILPREEEKKIDPVSSSGVSPENIEVIDATEESEGDNGQN